MPQPAGVDLAVGLFEEAAYGVEPGPAPQGDLLPVVSFGLAASEATSPSETLQGNRARGKPTRDSQDVTGAIVVELAGEPYGKLLKHLLGVVNTTGAGPYSHVFTHGDLPPGLTFDTDHGPKIVGVGRCERYHGCKMASAAFEFVARGKQRVTFNLQGAWHALAAAPLDAALTSLGHTAFTGANLSLEEGGDPIGYVRRVTLNVGNNLDGDQYAIGGGGKKRSLPEQFLDVAGEIELMYEDPALVQKAIAGDESSLRILLEKGDGDGAAGNESLELLIQQLDYAHISIPTGGPGPLIATIPWNGFRSNAGLPPLQATLKNAVAVV